MNIYALELNNDLKGISQRKQYIESMIATVQNPDLIVLPELALCSYMGSTEIWQYADVDSADTSKWAMEMAEKYQTYITVGYLEKKGSDYYNSYLIADKKKVYGIVRKSEGEASIYKRGDFPNVITTPLGNIAVAICYDAHRKLFYNTIKESMVSLILFPHGAPSDPKRQSVEQHTIDYFCNAYQNAFDVPVIYANSKGQLDFMMGRTGKMMAKAGFILNGMSAIYDKGGTAHSVITPEIICWTGDITPQKRKTDIRFYGEDIIKGNWFFRKLVLRPDIRDGVRFYKNKNSSKD